MLKTVYFDKTDALTENFSFSLDPINKTIKFTFIADTFLKDVALVIENSNGINSIVGVRDKNRYVKIKEYHVDKNPSFFGIFVEKILNLEYCGKDVDGYIYYSVPEVEYNIKQFYKEISYDNVFSILMGSDEEELDKWGISQNILSFLMPCPLCEDSDNRYKDKYSGVKANILFMQSNYGNKDNWLYVGKEPPIRISYCPKCGRKLPEEG